MAERRYERFPCAIRLALALALGAGCSHITDAASDADAGNDGGPSAASDAGGEADADTQHADAGTNAIDAGGDASDAGALSPVVEKAAEDWLALLDADDYAHAYESASALVHDAVSQEAFTTKLSAAADMVGTATMRTIVAADYVTDPPNAPAGEYVSIQYRTTFNNGLTLVETLSLVKESDGTWRMAGYGISQG